MKKNSEKKILRLHKKMPYFLWQTKMSKNVRYYFGDFNEKN